MNFNLIEKFLAEYSEFSMTPIVGSEIILKGNLNRQLYHEDFGTINIAYSLLIHVPFDYPEKLPIIFESKGAIPNKPSNHINPDGSFCLGSPLRLKILLKRNSDFKYFFENCVLPYLYAVTINMQQDGGFPFGELEHGTAGLILDLRDFFNLKDSLQVYQMLKILSSKKRLANRMVCPCGCKQRVTRCNYFQHILRMRKVLTRVEWEEQMQLILG
ncbi:hypothetical protein [Bacillus pseudomycoides]|uniref:hypothetical protein n=1 Tax=Bacillus pseudomycoides TaxID=64104 RepID=UPI000501BD2F|nr:hypothetical protein [Bacillus pseudomycoides]PEU03533.1 hypothetical protein CN527_05570 [Bacillus cereus]KFN13605.1 hypothetical protein DJ94_1456 [Bacillus pseudomycoides]MDR4187792.1 hypothetical protein [Bacillus pseudomycoides]MED0857247.1 hypothetical protein [Bacillus pseudomycoides]PGO02623.1 hypothetical protein CN976_07180 [Bacillus cereus]